MDFIFILMSKPYYSQKVPYFVVTQEPGVLLLDNILLRPEKTGFEKKLIRRKNRYQELVYFLFSRP